MGRVTANGPTYVSRDITTNYSRRNYIREIPAVTWLFVIFGLLLLAGGFTAMAFLKVEPAAITAFVTAIFGVVGTHLGHVSGSQQATKKEPE
jgi:hypothetical protein